MLNNVEMHQNIELARIQTLLTLIRISQMVGIRQMSTLSRDISGQDRHDTPEPSTGNIIQIYRYTACPIKSAVLHLKLILSKAFISW